LNRWNWSKIEEYNLEIVIYLGKKIVLLMDYPACMYYRLIRVLMLFPGVMIMRMMRMFRILVLLMIKARDRARLVCLHNHSSGAWLEVCPSTQLGLRLSIAEMRVLIKWSLGAPLLLPELQHKCPLCNGGMVALLWRPFGGLSQKWSST